MRLHLHRLRAMHAGGAAEPARARRPLVVGGAHPLPNSTLFYHPCLILCMAHEQDASLSRLPCRRSCFCQKLTLSYPKMLLEVMSDLAFIASYPKMLLEVMSDMAFIASR